MNYSAKCECGIEYPVAPTDAGCPIDCTCGQRFYVPSLSKLRESVGETPIPLNTVETIRAMIRDGKLPIDHICPYSGRPANEIVFFNVECEKSWTVSSEPSDFKKIIMVMIFGWLCLLFWPRKTQEYKEFGRDTSVDVPLRVSADLREKIILLKSQKLKELLCQTPIYAKLLQEYPKATIQALRDPKTSENLT